MAAFFSHLTSYFGFTKDSSAQVIFPGCSEVPEESCGYVRTNALITSSWKYRSGQLEPDKKCPFRDYPDSVKTSITKLVDTPYGLDRVIISARNVLNEWPYQARINGQWFRRYGDPDVPSHFPVLSIQASSLKVQPFSEAPNDSDILIGLPLVIDSQPMTRSFIIANSSDVAHSYECHPRGFFGPVPPAWQTISDKWYSEFKEWLKDPKRSDEVRTEQIDSVAQEFKGWSTGSHTSGADLTHSVIVDIENENLYAMVLTGTLWSIASYLAKKGAKNAFVLDQSGSVCYCYLAKGKSAPQPIISTTNWRDSGTSFLVIESGGYVPQVQHIWMQRVLDA